MACSYLAPNGNSSKLYNTLYKYYAPFYSTKEEAEKKAAAAWNLTHTPNFNSWFSESLARDANGEPLIVFYSSPNRFNVFDQNRIGSKKLLNSPDNTLGFFFTEDLDSVKEHDVHNELGNVIYPSFLRIINPDTKFYGKVARAIKLNEKVEGEVDLDRATDLMSNPDNRKYYESVLEESKSRNMDGIIDELIPFYVVYKSDQIKDIRNFGNWGMRDEGVDTIYKTFEGTLEEASAEIEDMVSKGLTVKSLKREGSKLHIRGEVEQGNIFFNDQSFDDRNPQPIEDYLSEGKSVKDILKSIVRTTDNPFNSELASRLLLAADKLPSIQIMSIEEMNARYPETIGKKNVNMFYDSKSDTVYVNNKLIVNPLNFENILLEEVVHALTYRGLSSDAHLGEQWNTLYKEAKGLMHSKGEDSRHLSNVYEFLHGVLRDASFRNKLDGHYASGSKKSILSRVIDFILSMFGVRKVNSEKMKIVLDKANAILNRGSVVPVNSSAMASLMINPEREGMGTLEVNEEELNEAIESSSVKTNAPSMAVNNYWQNKLTGNELIDKYILAHIEKVRSIKLQIGKSNSKQVNQLLLKEKSKFESILNQLHNVENPLLILDIATKELWILKNQLKSITSLDELGDNIKLLQAWSELATAIGDAIKEGTLRKEVKEGVTGASIEKIVGKATSLKGEYMEALVDLFKVRAEAEKVPPEVLAGVNISHAVKDIGEFASLFMGLSTGSDPYEIVSNFLIRRAAILSNSKWEDFQAISNRMFKSVGDDIMWMFEPDANGNMRIKTPHLSELYDQMKVLASEISEFEEDRKPLKKRLAEVKQEMFKFNNLKKSRGGTDAFDSEIKDLGNEFRSLNERISANEASTKTWDSYMSFMRDNFIMDNMKVTIPALLDDGSINPHADAGSIKEIRWSEMTEQEQAWALAPWEDYKEDLKQAYIYYTADNQPVLDKLKYNEQLDSENPINFLHWVNSKTSKLPVIRPKNGAQWFAFKPNDNWKNSSFYNGLSTTQKEFYDWFTSEFVNSHNNISQDSLFFGDYEKDKILREFVFTSEATVDKFKFLTRELTNFTGSLFYTHTPEETESGKLTLPLTGNERDVLRLKSFKKIITKDQGYYLKGQELPIDIQKKVDSNEYVWNHNDVLISAKGSFIKRVVPKMFDPIEMFKEYKKLSIAYEYKKDIEDILTTAKELVAVSEVEGKRKYGKIFTKKGANHLSDRLSTTIDAFLYDHRANRITSSEIEKGQKRFSLEQLVDTVNKFTRSRQLGFNPASGITNLLMGTINNYMFAARDEFFNEQDLHWAYWKLKDSIATFYSAGKLVTGESKKIMLLLKHFNVMGGLTEESFISDNDLSSIFNHLFIFQKGGEYLSQAAIMLAMMRKHKVMENGVEGSNLYDAYTVNEEGVLSIENKNVDYANPEKEVLLAGAIAEIIKEVHGDYDPLNFKVANKKLVTRALLTFRTWMPMAFETRLGGVRESAPLSFFAGKPVFREGRWITLARGIAGAKGQRVGVLESGKRVGRVFLGTVLSTFKRSWGTKVMGDLGLVNDYEKQNLAVMMKELWFMLAVTATGVMAKNMLVKIGDDDETNEKFFTWFFNQTSRIENDLWFYYSPQDFSKVVRDPIALWSTLNQTLKLISAGNNYIFNNDADTYKTGFRKGDSKFATQLEMFLPVVRQRQSIWTMMENVYSPVTVR